MLDEESKSRWRNPVSQRDCQGLAVCFICICTSENVILEGLELGGKPDTMAEGPVTRPTLVTDSKDHILLIVLLKLPNMMSSASPV